MSRRNSPKQMIINHLIKEQSEENKDSMVLNFAVSTKEIGVREQKYYMDYAKPEECKMKIRNALLVRKYANMIAQLTDKELENFIKDMERPEHA